MSKRCVGALLWCKSSAVAIDACRVLSLQEARLVIDLLEELLTLTGATELLGLDQLVADLRHRVAAAQDRQAAMSAGLTEVWPHEGGPGVLLSSASAGDVVRELRRLAVLEHDVDAHLAQRAHAAALMLTA